MKVGTKLVSLNSGAFSVGQNKTRLLSFPEFLQKLKSNCNFGITSKLLGKWKNYLKEENQTSTTNLLAIDKRTAEKKLMEMGFSKEEFKNISEYFCCYKRNKTFNVSV